MKKILLLTTVLIFSCVFLPGCGGGNVPPLTDDRNAGEEKNMKLTSPVFNNGDYIPDKYTCDGENVNPPLEISGVPENAKSLVLIIDDPDAPAGDWVHWTVWNIPPDTRNISENSVPFGVAEGLTDFGRPGYGGPCPPSGVHHYQFKLYALDILLNISASASKKDIEKAIDGCIISQTILVGIYKKG